MKLAEPYYSREGGPNRNGIRHRTVRGAGSALLKAEVISDETFALLLHLSNIRNAAAHSDEVTAADAIRFVHLALLLKSKLNEADK